MGQTQPSLLLSSPALSPWGEHVLLGVNSVSLRVHYIDNITAIFAQQVQEYLFSECLITVTPTNEALSKNFCEMQNHQANASCTNSSSSSHPCATDPEPCLCLVSPRTFSKSDHTCMQRSQILTSITLLEHLPGWVFHMVSCCWTINLFTLVDLTVKHVWICPSHSYVPLRTAGLPGPNS